MLSIFMKLSIAFFIFLFSYASIAKYPELWPKEDQYILRTSGVLKYKKKIFYYRVGSMAAGGFHYEFSIRLNWKKGSEQPFDDELSGFVSDSPDGKLSMHGNKLIFKTQNLEFDKNDNVKSYNINYCWLFDEKKEEFIEQDKCDHDPTPKQKNKK
jgi:hypothetical protein